VLVGPATRGIDIDQQTHLNRRAHERCPNHFASIGFLNDSNQPQIRRIRRGFSLHQYITIEVLSFSTVPTLLILSTTATCWMSRPLFLAGRNVRCRVIQRDRNQNVRFCAPSTPQATPPLRGEAESSLDSPEKRRNPHRNFEMAARALDGVSHGPSITPIQLPGSIDHHLRRVKAEFNPNRRT